MEAITNNVAADVIPVTRSARAWIIEPAPMKPMPGMICEAIRVGSVLLPEILIDSKVYNAAPTQMKRLVRKPAGRCLASRSRPMTPPRAAARSNLATSDQTRCIGERTGAPDLLGF